MSSQSSPSKPVILVDCDGVLADFTRAFLEIVKDKLGRNHVCADVTEWEFRDCITSKDEDKMLWEHIAVTPGIVAGLLPLPFVGGLAILRKYATVKCVTSPSLGPYWMYERHKWLMQVAGFSKRDIIFASDKGPIRGDFLVDDAVHNVEEWKAANPSGTAILLEQPWNWRGTPVAERLGPSQAFLRLLEGTVTL